MATVWPIIVILSISFTFSVLLTAVFSLDYTTTLSGKRIRDDGTTRSVDSEYKSELLPQTKEAIGYYQGYQQRSSYGDLLTVFKARPNQHLYHNEHHQKSSVEHPVFKKLTEFSNDREDNSVLGRASRSQETNYTQSTMSTSYARSAIGLNDNEWNSQSTERWRRKRMMQNDTSNSDKHTNKDSSKDLQHSATSSTNNDLTPSETNNSSSRKSDSPTSHLNPLYVSFRDNSRFWIQRVLVPILTVIGLFGNTITMIIMTRRRMRSTTNLYLAALAFVDMLYLILTFVLGLSHYPNITNKKYYAYWSMKPFLMMLTDSCSNTSVWLTVTFTIERYIAVRYPIQGKVWCTEARAKALIASVFIFGIAFASPVPFEWRVVEQRRSAEMNTTKSIAIRNMTTQSLENETASDESTNNFKSLGSSKNNDYYDVNNAISQSIAQTSIMSTILSTDTNRPNISLIDVNLNDQTKRNEIVAQDSNISDFDQRISNGERVILALEKSEFGNNSTYKTYYYWSTAVIITFIPCVSLMFFNGYLIKSVQQSRKQRTQMTNQPKRATKTNNTSNVGAVNNQLRKNYTKEAQLKRPDGRVRLSLPAGPINEQPDRNELIWNDISNTGSDKPFMNEELAIPKVRKVNFIRRVFERLSIRDEMPILSREEGESTNLGNARNNTEVMSKNNHQKNRYTVGDRRNLCTPAEQSRSNQVENLSPQVSNSDSSISLTTCKQMPLIGIKVTNENVEYHQIAKRDINEENLLEPREKANMSLSSRDSSPNSTVKSPLSNTKCHAQQQRQQNQPPTASKQERRITIMLIAVVILFLVCQIPSAVMLIYSSVNESKEDTNEGALVTAFNNIFNFLMAVNAACNFVLYSFLSQKYRRTFVQLFCPCLKSNKDAENADLTMRDSRGNFIQRGYNKNIDKSVHKKSTMMDSCGHRPTVMTLVLSAPCDVKCRPFIQRCTKEEAMKDKQRARHQFDSEKMEPFVEGACSKKSTSQLDVIKEPIKKIMTEQTEPEDACKVVCIVDQ